MKKNIIGTNKYIGINGYIYSEDGRRFSRWVDNVGYYQSVFVLNGKKKYVRIHRLLAEYFLEKEEDCNIVNHIDGNKLNNDISNLEWTTNSKNTQHAYDNGLYKSKYKCGVIATHKETGEEFKFRSIRSCSEELGLNRKTITSILKGNKSNNYDYDFKYEL